MTSLPKTIVLHIGAHKTASTHLQRSLAAADLPDVAFHGPQDLRQPGRSLKERFRLARGARVAETRATLAEMAAGAARLVLSEENFAGPLQSGWGRIPMPLYPQAADRVSALCATVARAGGPKVDLCLAIRDPALFLTSAYSQVLKGKRVVQPEKFIAKNPVAGVDWVDYVQRLRAVPGLGRLTVWRQEDYGVIFPQVCNAMVGAAPVQPFGERSQQRLSQAALDAILLAKSQGLPNVVDAAALAHPVAVETPAFHLFDAATRVRSAELYAAQCTALEATSGVTVLRA